VNLTSLEVFLIGLQVLLVPFVRYILEQNRKEIIHQLLTTLNEQYNSLNALITNNKNTVEKLEQDLEYKAKIIKFKTKTLIARISDLEAYLNKTSGFQPKCNFFFEFDEEDDGPPSGHF